jgi:dTDP-4-amino-4,6-dideoxygalactose transaminase
MYRPGTMMCLSFWHTKPLHIGHGGAILLDDQKAYETIVRQRYDGRDLDILPWETQKTFRVGYHYKPSVEDAELGLALLEGFKDKPESPKFVAYPDLRNIKIEI